MIVDWRKALTSINVAAFKLSSGRLGSKMGKQSVLLLHTVGHKTGKHYLTTVSYYRDGEDYLVVASNWGKESHPGWYFNLLKQPKTIIQVESKTIHVEACPAEEGDYMRLWTLVTEHNQQYVNSQKKMKRRIPIVVLSPTTTSAAEGDMHDTKW